MSLRNRPTFSILIFSLFGVSLSFLKFKYCFDRDFSGLAAVSHGCYTDIPIFWNSHLLEAHLWPYAELNISELNVLIKPIEYPFLTGLIMWILSYITPLGGNSDGNFFVVNTIFISLLFIASFLILNKIKPKSYFLISLAPAVAFSLLINWDMWVMFTLLLALYFYDQSKYNVALYFWRFLLVLNFSQL